MPRFTGEHEDHGGSQERRCLLELLIVIPARDLLRLVAMHAILDRRRARSGTETVLAWGAAAGQCEPIDPLRRLSITARARFTDSRASFDCGSALYLPYPNASFDRCLSLLVFQFLKQPGVAASEMRRVTRASGTVAACTWDRTGQEMSELFWQEAVRLDPRAEEKSQRPKVCNRSGQLAELWKSTGFEEVREVVLEMQTGFRCFNDFWLPYTKGVGPQGAYVHSLAPAQREDLRDALRRRFVGDRDEPFSLRAIALAVRGTCPR
jgi:SAM-dependent methyltransferase